MIFLYIQTLCLILKIDNIVNWNWKEVFWAFWVYFAIMVGISFAALMTLFSKICSYFFGEVNKFESNTNLFLIHSQFLKK